MSFTLRKHEGHPYWFARGTVPVRTLEGTITNIRIEKSTREENKARAARVAQKLWDYYHEQAYSPKPKVVTFSDACVTYVETKHTHKRDRDFLSKLIPLIGDTPVSEVTQTKVADLCSRLYPGCKASTHHRAVWAPVTMVLRLQGLEPHFKKPKIEKAEIAIPSDDWFDKVLPHCDNQLQGLLIFLRMTGRRVSEALKATYDGPRTYSISRTKTGDRVIASIPGGCIDHLGDYKHGQRLFTYGDRHNVYRALRPACEKAGVEFYGLHAIGRHSFATGMLKAGYSVKHVARAGGWKSERMVLERYGHIEKDEAIDAAMEVGEEWLSKRTL